MSTSLPEWLKAGGVVLLWCYIWTSNNDFVHMFWNLTVACIETTQNFLVANNGKTVFFSGTGIDTAYDYYSSEDIAAVLKRHPHIKRSSLFITTKVWVRYLSKLRDFVCLRAIPMAHHVGCPAGARGLGLVLQRTQRGSASRSFNLFHCCLGIYDSLLFRRSLLFMLGWSWT